MPLDDQSRWHDLQYLESAIKCIYHCVLPIANSPRPKRLRPMLSQLSGRLKTDSILLGVATSFLPVLTQIPACLLEYSFQRNCCFQKLIQLNRHTHTMRCTKCFSFFAFNHSYSRYSSWCSHSYLEPCRYVCRIISYHLQTCWWDFSSTLSTSWICFSCRWRFIWRGLRVE